MVSGASALRCLSLGSLPLSASFSLRQALRCVGHQRPRRSLHLYPLLTTPSPVSHSNGAHARFACAMHYWLRARASCRTPASVRELFLSLSSMPVIAGFCSAEAGHQSLTSI